MGTAAELTVPSRQQGCLLCVGDLESAERWESCMEGIFFYLDLSAGFQNSRYLLSSGLCFYNVPWVWTGNILGPVDASQQFQMWFRSAFLKIEGNSFKSAPGVKIKLILKCGIAPFCLSVLNLETYRFVNHFAKHPSQMDNTGTFP